MLLLFLFAFSSGVEDFSVSSLLRLNIGYGSSPSNAVHGSATAL